MLHNRKIPGIGGRILKSSLASELCILIYELRTLLLAEQERTKTLQNLLNGALSPAARVVSYPSPYPGFCYLKIMSAAATKQAMLLRLQEVTQKKQAVTFGSIPGAYDVLIQDGGGDATVKKLKQLSHTKHREV